MHEEYWDSEEEFIGEMLMSGAMDKAYHEDGELYFSWNEEVLKSKYPKVHETILNAQVEETLSGLVDKGLVDMAFEEREDGSIEAVYSLSDEGRRVAESMFGETIDRLREEYPDEMREILDTQPDE